ncbi:MAG: hypothetical protein RLY97_782, partial [Pseudomonadota bacterium]
MRMKKPLLRSAPLLSLLAICFTISASPIIAAAKHPPARSAAKPASKPIWPWQASDIAVDPAYVFGKLANGMRYIIRKNANPAGTVLVRFDIAAGSLAERDDERGYAHFLEHMAFQGSTHVPAGQMIPLLERKGLAFGADTNAETGLDHTTYMLDLPNNKPELLDTALKLMRETASELTIDNTSVQRESGVILAEKRDRNSWQMRSGIDQIKFAYAGSRLANYQPSIGSIESINAATSAKIRGYWQREYVPAHATLIVIGDIDPKAIEHAIAQKFASWKAAKATPIASAGPISATDQGRTSIYLDPASPERLTIMRNGAFQDEQDTVATQRKQILRLIGYAIINRRMQSAARRSDPPYQSANFGSDDVFKEARTTALIVNSNDGAWAKGLAAAAAEYRRALANGFTTGEINEQVANVGNYIKQMAAGANTSSNSDLLRDVISLLRKDSIPAIPAQQLALFNAFIPQITPEAVLAELKYEAVPLDNPLIRFQGKQAPDGGEKALRSAWDSAMATPISAAETQTTAKFAYGDFGPAGSVVSDMREPLLGIRRLIFANGVKLNLKHNDFEKDRIYVNVTIDGGQMLATKANPLATAMTSALASGGLGKHSQDELQSLLAGHTL